MSEGFFSLYVGQILHCSKSRSDMLLIAHAAALGKILLMLCPNLAL